MSLRDQRPNLLGNEYEALCFRQVTDLITNKESEANMPEFEHNREERIDAVIANILSSKENAIKWMYEAGLADAEGHLIPLFR